MNLYVLVEGDSVEPKVYPSWINFINSELKQVTSLNELSQDTYYLFSGGGYPQYLDRIRDAILDVNDNPGIDRLVVAVDSEEMSVAEKTAEINAVVQQEGFAGDFRLIVQHCCFESWCLANRKISPRNPRELLLRSFKEFYDVGVLDPSKMTSIDSVRYTKAQFAKKYLKECLKEQGGSYSESNPKFVAHERFAFHVRKRWLDMTHIASFASFITAFQ